MITENIKVEKCFIEKCLDVKANENIVNKKAPTKSIEAFCKV
jgi:hypothetical protein